MLKLSNRVTNIKPSATLAIDALAKELKASGEPVIGFVAGEPDFNTPHNVIEATQNELNISSNYKYSQTSGLKELKDLIAQKTNLYRQTDYSGDNVVVTNGGKQAVFQVLAALLDPKSVLLLPTPYWLTYPEVVNFFDASIENFDIDLLMSDEYALPNNAKAILINSPNNPTGNVLTREQLKKIAQFALKNNLWVISDEIYKHLYYEGNDGAPTIAQVSPEILNNLIIVDGVAKTYAMTGWRVGWCVAPKIVATAITNLQSHLTSNVNNIAQKAAFEALANCDQDVEFMRIEFKKRRDLIVNMLKEVKSSDSARSLKISIPQGAFYAFVDVSDFLNIPLKDYNNETVICKSAYELSEFLLKSIKVATVPMESFGVANHLRFSYALSQEQIIEGITRLKKFFLRQ